MKLVATIVRSVEAGLQSELRNIERAVASGTREAGRGLRTELRRQVTTAALGERLANSWRDKHYANRTQMPRAWSTPRRRRSSALSTKAR